MLYNEFSSTEMWYNAYQVLVEDGFNINMKLAAICGFINLNFFQIHKNGQAAETHKMRDSWLKTDIFILITHFW